MANDGKAGKGTIETYYETIRTPEDLAAALNKQLEGTGFHVAPAAKEEPEAQVITATFFAGLRRARPLTLSL